MSDLISRQAAIDALRTCQTYLFDTHDKDKKISLEDAEYGIEQLPSAQPETHEERTETHACDCVSRQAAIGRAVEIPLFGKPVKVVAVSELRALPSAEPEQQIPQMRGWVCPVCGRGLSPYTSVCPCNNGKGWEITC